jgi:peptidoglycan/xylan/chitin deacetylase (PgdA/CDA1 family)
LVVEFPHRLYLTFDVEDFINDRSLNALRHILELLRQRHQKGLFFITGHMAEKLARFPQVVDLLDEHEIGYHSTSHSVHPAVFEYTDVGDYQEAYHKSLSREVAHVNPLSGAIEGRGGIEALRDLFPRKKIESFRAPGFSWSPPHLEALAHLGVRYDFSTDISDVPVEYRGVTFFPFPSFIDSVPLRSFLRSVMRRKVTVVDFHPNFFVNEDWWDSIFFSGNPNRLDGVAPRKANRVKSMFRRFAVLLRIVDILSKMKITESCTEVAESETELDSANIDIDKVYRIIASWPVKRFNYEPRFIRSHLSHFFEPT